MKSKLEELNINFFDIFLFFAPFLIGGFYEWASCIFSAVISVYAIVVYFKNKQFIIPLNITSLVLIAFPALYLLTYFWAIDKYYSIIGFLKFLPVILFYLLVRQFDEKNRNFLRSVPLSGAAMTVLSLVLGFIPLFKENFYNQGRITGFFQYANAFAIFLLVGIITVAFKEKFKLYDAIVILILIAGIFLSGSRTVFALTVLTMIFLVISRKNIRKISIIGFASIAAVAVIYVLVTDNMDTVGRFLRMSLTESSFVGRILYYKDALKMILKHPFGMGYLGYHFAQAQYQTGYYLVKYVHNDLLQIMLDIGIVPGVAFIVVIFKNIFSKQVSLKNKLIISVISLHCLLDFDLQFMSIFMILVLCMNDKGQKEIVLGKKSKYSFRTTSIITSIVSIFFAVTFLFSYFKMYSVSYSMYKYNTEIEIEMLTSCKDIKMAESLANHILSHNKNVYQAYDVLAVICQKNGDFDDMIKYKKQAIKIAKYNSYEYAAYYDMLKELIENPDYRNEKEKYIIEIKELPNMIWEVMDSTDKMAWMIRDKPNIELTVHQLSYIESL